MIQIAPQMKILVAVEPADFRKGIDGLAQVCKEVLKHDPFGGQVFVFRNRPATAARKFLCTTAKVFGFAISVCPVAASAGGRLMERRRPKHWRPTNCMFFSRQAIPKRCKQPRRGDQLARPIDAMPRDP